MEVAYAYSIHVDEVGLAYGIGLATAHCTLHMGPTSNRDNVRV